MRAGGRVTEQRADVLVDAVMQRMLEFARRFIHPPVGNVDDVVQQPFRQPVAPHRHLRLRQPGGSECVRIAIEQQQPVPQ